MPHVVCCFAYNRPTHLRKTLESLSANPLARETTLIAVVDGPIDDEDMRRVEQVRQIVKELRGFKEVVTIFRPDNLGTVGSLVPAITQVLADHGAAIFLEDDVIVSSRFLDFMNAALDCYKLEPRVMSVSGYMFPVRQAEILPETFLYRKGTSFAWGTWQESWSHLSMDCASLLKRLDALGLRDRLDGEGTFKLTDILVRDGAQLSDATRASWSPRWFASMVLAQGLSLYPRYSLSNNIGFDGSGVRSPMSSAWDVVLGDFSPTTFPSVIDEHPSAHQVMLEAYAAVDRSRRMPPPLVNP